VPRPGKKKASPPRRSSPYSSPRGGQPCLDLARTGFVLLVDVLDDDLLGAVDGALGNPAREPGLPGQGGVAAGVDEAVGVDLDVAVAGGQIDGIDVAAGEGDVLQHGAEHGPDAEAADRLFQPAPEGDLVVEDGHRVAALVYAFI